MIMKTASSILGLTLLAASACGSSYAEPNRRPAFSGHAESEPNRAPAYAGSSYEDPDRTYRPSAPWSDPGPMANSPYRVEILSGDAGRLPTFYSSGRAYVLGTIGERYRIRIANPTA